MFSTEDSEENEGCTFAGYPRNTQIDENQKSWIETIASEN
jgi:hypothetical protein